MAYATCTINKGLAPFVNFTLVKLKFLEKDKERERENEKLAAATARARAESKDSFGIVITRISITRNKISYNGIVITIH